MDFEWNPDKRLRNLEKHGIDFEGAVRIFDGPVLERPDDRQDYGESRILAFGEVDGVVIAVVYTDRGTIRRIISARRARRNEREAYRATLER